MQQRSAKTSGVKQVEIFHHDQGRGQLIIQLFFWSIFWLDQLVLEGGS